MTTAFEDLAALLARLRGLFAGLAPHEDALHVAVPALREWWGLSGLAVYRTGEPESGADEAPLTCLAAVGSLAHLPVHQAVGRQGLDADIVGVEGRFLDGLLLPVGSSPEDRGLAGVVGPALDYELQGRATEQRLGERVKELRTLREVQVAIQEAPSLDELVHRVAVAIPPGLQAPHIARVELDVDGRHATAGAHGDVADQVEVRVTVGDHAAGHLRLGYVEVGVVVLPEERDLARAIAEALGIHFDRRAAQAALSSGERRRQQVMDALPLTLFSVDRDRVVEMLAVDGELPIDDPAGWRFALDQWDDPAVPRLSDAIDRAFGGESLREEFAWRDGFWDVWLEPVRAPDGGTDGVLGMVVDATSRHRSRELEARLAALVDSANLAIVGMAIDGTITSWNQGAVRLFGWSAEEAIGRDITLIDTHDPDAVSVRYPQQEIAAGRGEDSYLETFRRSRDGREIPVGVSLAFIRDADGRAVGLSAIYQDLSAQVRATDALAASEQQFRLIADNAQDVIYRVDVRDQPRLEYLNAAAETVLGFSRERLLSDRRLIVEQTRPEDRDVALGSVIDPQGGTFVSRWQREDGRWIVIEDRRTVLLEGGRPAMIIGIARDITDQQEAVERTREELAQERRIAEELRELDEMKTAFLSAVSHELRTPLTSVLGFADTARRHVAQADPDLTHYLERLLANAQRLRVLMDDLLDVDRLSRSEVTPRRHEVDLADLARRSVRSREAPAHWFHLELTPVTLPLDVVMIDRVIDNLVRNAGRHTPVGTNVWVRVLPTDEGARLVIEDDGPGVPPEDRERIFDPFQQGRGVSTQASPGTGIGLSLVRRFVGGGRGPRGPRPPPTPRWGRPVHAGPAPHRRGCGGRIRGGWWSEPRRGLEPLTDRLQGGCSTGLSYLGEARKATTGQNPHVSSDRITGRCRAVRSSATVLRMPVPRAQLKVFAPLESFPPRERERWAAYVDAAGGLTRTEHADVEDAAATRLLTGRASLGPDAALVRRAGRQVLVCPLDLELRAAVAMESFRRTIPDAVADAFVPDVRLRGVLESLSTSGRMPHVIDEPWSVPLHWFVAFDPSERRVREHPEGHGPRLVYVTTCDQALDRLEQAIEVVEETLEDGDDILAALASITAWVDAFDPSSLLELDYARVAALFTPEEIRGDTTCEDLWQAIEALEVGDLLTAAATYGVVRARWSDRWVLQHVN